MPWMVVKYDPKIPAYQDRGYLKIVAKRLDVYSVLIRPADAARIIRNYKRSHTQAPWDYLADDLRWFVWYEPSRFRWEK